MIVSGYRHHEGMHCESACQRNALLATGVDIAESVIFGLDGSFGFSFFAAPGNHPDVIVGTQATFPLQAARLMGITVETYKDGGGDRLVALLSQQRVIVTRVDIGLLPYWGPEGWASFGGYFINVVGHDPAARRFEVSDPTFADLQSIDAEELSRARSSRRSAPINPENRCYVFAAPKGAPQLDSIGPVAVRSVCREVLRPALRNLGLPGIRSLIDAARRWPDSKRGAVVDVDRRGDRIEWDALTRQLVHFGRQIEGFGKGGGLLRPMMSEFVAAVGAATRRSELHDAARGLSESGEVWGKLAQDLLSLGEGAVAGAREELAEATVDALQRIARLEKSAFESLQDC